MTDFYVFMFMLKKSPCWWTNTSQQSNLTSKAVDFLSKMSVTQGGNELLSMTLDKFFWALGLFKPANGRKEGRVNEGKVSFSDFRAWNKIISY